MGCRVELESGAALLDSSSSFPAVNELFAIDRVRELTGRLRAFGGEHNRMFSVAEAYGLRAQDNQR